MVYLRCASTISGQCQPLQKWRSDMPVAARASSELALLSDCRAALAQLRAAGEAAWGGGLPAALDEEVLSIPQTLAPRPT